ncbi:MAG TPA: hypothetical protein VFG73_08965 [Rhodanobacteraceae bacterium]|nr:hypothetical protein [Rhodanobacteraceae bacterium]
MYVTRSRGREGDRGLPLIALGGLLLAALLPGQARAQDDGDIIFQSGFEGPVLELAAIAPDPAYGGTDPTVRTGPDGIVHLIYAGEDGQANEPVRYGECAGNCSTVANWHFITLGTYGSLGLGGSPRLALDAAGHPRVLWYSQAEVAGTGAYVYGQCDGNCTSAANWTILAVASYADGMAFPLTGKGFAVDPAGHPAFVFQDAFTGVQYASCNNACTSAANWYATAINLSSDADLSFAATGKPRVIYTTTDTNTLNTDLAYAACDTNCGNAANWSVTGLAEVASGIVSVPHAAALTAAGMPRMAYYVNNMLAIGGCDGNCGTLASWGGAMTTLPKHAGYKGVALALNSVDAPLLAYGGSPDGVSDDSANVAACTADCYGSAPAWTNVVIETAADIPTPAPDPCGTGDSFWQVGTDPSMAIDTVAHIAYESYSYATCPDGEGGKYVTTIDGPIRYAER